MVDFLGVLLEEGNLEPVVESRRGVPYVHLRGQFPGRSLLIHQ